MLSEFYNEVLTYGPVAVLPQNLNDKWIQQLQKMADDFLDSNFNLTHGRSAIRCWPPAFMKYCAISIAINMI
jgi:hypothetical protein